MSAPACPCVLLCSGCVPLQAGAPAFWNVLTFTRDPYGSTGFPGGNAFSIIEYRGGPYAVCSGAQSIVAEKVYCGSHESGRDVR